MAAIQISPKIIDSSHAITVPDALLCGEPLAKQSPLKFGPYDQKAFGGAEQNGFLENSHFLIQLYELPVAE